MTDRLYLLFIASLPIVQVVNVRLAGFLVPVADPIFVLAGLAWFVNVLRKRSPLRFTWFYVALAIYFATLCLSAAASQAPRQSLVKLVGIVYLMGVSVVTINLVRSWTFLRSAMTAWMVGTGITAAAGVIGVVLFYAGVRDASLNLPLMHYGSLPPGNYPRLKGLFENPNMMCNYMNVSLMILFIMHALGWMTPLRTRLLLAGSWLTTFLSLSPGVGGVFFGAGLWRWLREGPGRRSLTTRLLFGCGAVAAVALVVMVTIFPANTGDLGENTVPVLGGTARISHRVFIWQQAFRTFTHYPVLGQGPNTRLASFEWVNPSGRTEHLTDAHNVFLSIAGQQGIVGFVAFLYLMGYVCRCTWPADTDPDSLRTVKMGLGIAFVSVLFYHGLSGSFEDARHLWALIGMIVAVDSGLSGDSASSVT